MEYEGIMLYTNDTWNCHNDCLKHVRKGCLSDPLNVPLYEESKVLGNGLTVWESVRGTSQLEGFHAHQVSRYVPVYTPTIRPCNISSYSLRTVYPTTTRPGIIFVRLFAHSVPVYPTTLRPSVIHVRLTAHIVPVYP